MGSRNVPPEDDEGDDVDLGSLVAGNLRRERQKSWCLVGRLISDKSVNGFALMEVMRKSFKAKGKLSMRE